MCIRDSIASLLCIVIGLLIGYLVLLIINPAGAAGAITAIIKNYFYYPSQKAMMKYMGTTLVKASALLMCSLSVLFAYKVGLFNIGAAGPVSYTHLDVYKRQLQGFFVSMKCNTANRAKSIANYANTGGG